MKTNWMQRARRYDRTSILDLLCESVKICQKRQSARKETKFLLTQSKPFQILGSQIADFSPFFDVIKTKGWIKFRRVPAPALRFCFLLPDLHKAQDLFHPTQWNCNFHPISWAWNGIFKEFKTTFNSKPFHCNVLYKAAFRTSLFIAPQPKHKGLKCIQLWDTQL